VARVIVGIRWLAVLPAAILGAIVANVFATLLAFVLGLIYRTVGDGEIEGPIGAIITFMPPRTFTMLMQNLLYPVGAIWLGARMAPAFRLPTAYGLAIAFLLFFGASLVLLGRPGAAGNWAFGEVLAGAACGVLGVILGVRSVASAERKGYGSGWRSWVGAAEPIP
jgi:hypothetical protein